MCTARHLADQLRRCTDAGIRVFIIRGNHDAVSRITNEFTLPHGVFTVGPKADAIEATSRDRSSTVAIQRPLVRASACTQEYLAPVEGVSNIALMHTSLGGAPGHDPYAPNSVREVRGAGMDSWALDGMAAVGPA